GPAHGARGRRLLARLDRDDGADRLVRSRIRGRLPRGDRRDARDALHCAVARRSDPDQTGRVSRASADGLLSLWRSRPRARSRVLWALMILLDGGTVFMMADGWGLRGRQVLRVTVTGGAVVIMPGWLTLWCQTGACVLPVLTHLAGRTQVVAIHPPLERDGGGEEAWPERLSSIVRACVDRFPEECANP